MQTLQCLLVVGVRIEQIGRVKVPASELTPEAGKVKSEEKTLVNYGQLTP